MRAVERWLTPVDRKLLAALDRTPNVVHAARGLGITRDRAVYRLQRLRRLYGKPAAIGHRGGGAVGATTLTPFGRSLLHGPGGGHARANRWQGTFEASPTPHVDLGEGRRLEVAFRGQPGESVCVEVDPETFVIARGRFESSARNVLEGRVEALRPLTSGRVVVLARWAGLPLRALVTPGSVKRLRLAPGRPAFFYLKAVAVRRA